MSQSKDGSGNWKPTSHDLLWWVVLIPLLLVVLLLGRYVTLSETDRFPYVLGVGAFSIAYALHFFAVSIALCGLYIREDDPKTSRRLREMESRVVTSAMCALAGGLGIILAGGLCAIGNSVAAWVYVAAGTLLFLSVLKYVLCERKWPWKVRHILGLGGASGGQPAQRDN